MEKYTVFPDKPFTETGPISRQFRQWGVSDFHAACRIVHELPYGYNSDRDDLMILFKEKMGSCTTKHAVIATLAAELHLPIEKQIGIYPLTEDLVTGTRSILEKHALPYVPMVHCFLAFSDHRVDLSEGNRNGKNGPIEEFFTVQTVQPNISAKDEYLLYRKALTEIILRRPEMQGIDLKRVLKAREDGLALLRAKVRH